MHDYATKRGAKIQMAGVITSRKIRSSARGKYAFIQMSDLHGLFKYLCLMKASDRSQR